PLFSLAMVFIKVSPYRFTLFLMNQYTILSSVGDCQVKNILDSGAFIIFRPLISCPLLVITLPVSEMPLSLSQDFISMPNCMGGLGSAPETVIALAGKVPLSRATSECGAV